MKTVENALKTDTGARPATWVRRSVADLLEPLDRLAADSPNLIANHKANFEIDGQPHSLPRYLFIGPRGGDEPIRVGIFATLGGDEPEGAHALVRFLRLLDANAHAATGYCLFIYPVCDPAGFEEGTSHKRRGRDLAGDFWKNSSRPEVRLLQTEILFHAFHGLIVLRSSGAINGFTGHARGATLTRHLVGPALQSAEQFVPLAQGNDALEETILTAPSGIQPRPFEVLLQSTQNAPSFLKECAFVTALHTILLEYRKFIAYARNI
jgi:murein peptide amidase A